MSNSNDMNKQEGVKAQGTQSVERGQVRTENSQKSVPFAIFNRVIILNKLILEAGRHSSLDDLVFFILNHSIEYIRYDRALLWKTDGKAMLLGVSGNVDVKLKSTLLKNSKSIVDALSNSSEPQILSEKSFTKIPRGWESLIDDHGHTAIVWCPVVKDNKVIAGLWLERWSNKPWDEPELRLLNSLVSGYAISWTQFYNSGNVLLTMLRKKWIAFVLILAVIISSILVKAPLRVITECEVIPKEPVSITAPLDGVLQDISIKPGDRINKGDLLFAYDKRVALEQLNISRQQMNLILSDIEQKKAEAFDDPEAKRAISLLENRLKQEQIKLRIAEYRASRLNVAAETSGVILMGDPNDWVGRPVTVGEKVLQIVDPEQSKLRIWLPQDDKIDFKEDAAITVILNTNTSKTKTASISYLSRHAVTAPNGISSFLAEAEWKAGEESNRMGVKGTAILYGEEVPLWYWILRRPLGIVRKSIGI